MPTSWVLLQDGCLLDCGHSISMPADLLSLNISCWLALCFSICYNLLVWCLDILTSWVQMEEGWLQVWCYSYRGAITSDMSADPVPLSDRPAFTVQLYQTCLLGSYIPIHVFVKCVCIRQDIWYVTNPPDIPTGKVRPPRVCKTN